MTALKTIRLTHAELVSIDAALSAERKKCEQLLETFPEFWQELLDQARSAQRVIRKALYPNLTAEHFAQFDKRFPPAAIGPADTPTKAT